MSGGDAALLGALRRLLQDLGPHDTALAADRLASLDVAALVDSALHDCSDRLVERFVADSYTHHNGFDKISFPPVGDSSARLRLHIWPAGRRAEPADLHNHRWSFASRILAGSIRNGIHVAAERPDGRYVHYRHSQMAGSGYRFAFVGRADLTLERSFVSNTGDVYVMPADPIHQVGVDGSGTSITSVVELPPIRRDTDVYTSSRERPTGATLDVPRFSVQLVRVALAEVRSALS